MSLFIEYMRRSDFIEHMRRSDFYRAYAKELIIILIIYIYLTLRARTRCGIRRGREPRVVFFWRGGAS